MTAKTYINFRVPPPVAQELDRVAGKTQRSRAGLLRYIVDSYLERFAADETNLRKETNDNATDGIRN